jgi:hypothetical protein
MNEGAETMTSSEFYQLICDTYYGPSQERRTEQEVIEHLTIAGVIPPGTTDFAIACVEGNPQNGLSDATTAALEPWIFKNAP